MAMILPSSRPPQTDVYPHRCCLLPLYSTLAGQKTPDKGIVLGIYTDGITEAENERLEIYGVARLRDDIVRLQGMDSKAMMAKILEETKHPACTPRSQMTPR